MSLAALGEYVWEVLHRYLLPHHLARLFATGDKPLQHMVVCAHRATDFASLPDNDLISTVLLPHTVHAKAKAKQLLRRAPSDCNRMPRIRSLTLHGVHRGVAADGHMNLAYLANLEAFEAYSTMDDVTLTLPTNLTNLSSYHLIIENILNFSALVNVVQLGLGLTLRQLGLFRRGLIKWSPHLTSLKIISPCQSRADAESFDDALRVVLPATLLHLILEDGGFSNSVLDIIPPAVCSMLESFELVGKSFDCNGKHAPVSFPPTLKRLAVSKTRTLSPRLFQALASSPSLTSLNIDFAATSASDARNLCSLLPRLDTESVERLVFYIASWCHWDKTIADACLSTLTRLGIDARYLTGLECLRLEASEVIESGIHALTTSPHMKRAVQRGDGRVRKLVLERAHHVPEVFRWAMSLGVYHSVDASQLALLGGDALHTSVRRLVLNTECLDDSGLVKLKETLACHDLSCIQSIIDMSDRSYDVAVALHENRHKLRTINDIFMCSASPSDPRAEEILALFAQMRIYPVPDTTGHFRFLVSPPVPRE